MKRMLIGVGGVRYIRWTVSINDKADGMQAAEFTIYDKDKQIIKYSKASAIAEPIGMDTSAWVEYLIDNNFNNKFYNRALDRTLSRVFDYTTVTIDLGELLPVRYYGYYTGNDMPNRDPASWTVDVSADGKGWHRASEVTDFQATSNRNALAGQWELKY